MTSKEGAPTVTEGLILGHEGFAVAGLLAMSGAFVGPAHGCQPERLLDQVQDALEHSAPRPSVVRRPWRRPASLQVLHPELRPAGALPITRGEDTPRAACDRLVADGARISATLLPTKSGNPDASHRFHRLAGLSGLGWAFVLAAILWELFALAFSRCSGCGWATGAFFFTWGLGVLAFGLLLRTGRERPAAARLFLGVNILVVSVLSLVVATR